MTIGHGIDMTSVERIRELACEELTLKRVFTETELAEGFSVRETDRRLAMVFASKEAVMKALGTGWAKGVGWKDIEVTGFSGRPLSARLSGMAGEILGSRSVMVDATSTGSIAVAVAIIEG